MSELEIVYKLRKRINRLENKLKSLTCENVHSNPDINKRTVARINKIQAKIITLKGIHNDQITQVYSTLGNRPKTAPVILEISMKITEIDIGDNITTLKMTPTWFKPDDRKTALKDIIYPTDGTDRDLVNTAARYRTIFNKSKDFCDQPLEVNQNSTETLIIALDAFVRQFGGELSFTNNDLSFSDSAEHTAAGVANLGSVHLIAGDYIPTAKFSLKVNLNYDRDLAQSTSTMKHFILDFTREIADLLHCKNDYVRIFSIEKIVDRRDMVKINFGLTTTDKQQTESLARYFQTFVRRSDFRNKKVLRYIESARYQYQLITLLSYLQLNPQDFDISHNFDYTQTDLSEQDRHRSSTIGWYRHALNLNKKCSENTDGEWIIAYHGTHSQVVSGINRHHILLNSSKRNAMKKSETSIIQPGLNVATHCNGGADAYSIPFKVSNGDNTEIYRLVFQCRVKSNSFNIHTGDDQMGQTYRIRDPQAIRPYGLLLKNETTLV